GGEAASLVTPATKNLDAYHLCLKGRYLLAQRGLGLRKALECFDQAIALDPNYALAHAGLAEACTVLAQYGLVPPAMLRANRRAVELDPLSPLPSMQLGMSLMGAGRLEEAVAPLERAAALAPTMFLPPIHLGLLYNELGRKEAAIRSVEAAVVTSGRHPWTLC